ncbi:UDP-N-acetylmuramoyl-L-alanine--D-glutamate ligase [Gordonia sp. HY442]|uniref:UDP-N-acetylmuramoyl-L-alanine--D-glutamate ligase n=1 Tax=Gordonia zhenghanii TaxID=2911516 RepID=UPI001F027E18|nr:UDP-N-acetylmuramoyl-L-alanine--D-glutamate ligase [Gordonia zhenghanii]MCF8605030.1 UDP-N-acetylmuramoyl-L-alanine--D-glutamate ligase [Gordonia zhenghanii]MCF8606171.1 UDP-N-acetylmuramoyl-L-alanine--D-glutamate ligase [Gordonia zhenghanii]
MAADVLGAPLVLEGARVLVAGARATGLSVLDLLLEQGATVTMLDTKFIEGAVDPDLQARDVAMLGPDAFAGPDASVRAPSDVDLIVVSPGFRPDDPLLEASAAAGIPVWGDVELAWRVDRSGVYGPPRTWLVITGTNGKTTTTSMAEAIGEAANLPIVACGNIGLTVVDALRTDPRVEVLCVEMSSFQLHWAPSVRPAAGVVLNVAPDHLDWHGSFEAYAQAKQRALLGDVAIVGLDDDVASGLPVGDGARRIGFTLGAPESGDLGVIEGTLVDRAFAGAPVPLIAADRVRPAGPSGRADALAAAALMRAAGVSADAVERGLADFSPGAHRGQVVGVVDGVSFVDDSKATNPHAAQAAVAAFDRVVLIAGGLLKGAAVDDLITRNAQRLAGVVAIGADREVILEAIARHAPEVPAVTVFTRDDGSVMTQRTGDDTPAITATGADGADAVMAQAVSAAWQLAEADARGERGGVDAVLLAPAAASLDMFASYGARGDSFAAASAALADARLA